MTATHKYGYGWRLKKGVLQKKVFVEVEPRGSVPEFCQALTELAAEYEEVKVTDDMKYGEYGNRDRDLFGIQGWRMATAEEIRLAQEEIDRREEWQKNRDAEDLERLKRLHPEEFKSG